MAVMTGTFAQLEYTKNKCFHIEKRTFHCVESHGLNGLTE